MFVNYDCSYCLDTPSKKAWGDMLIGLNIYLNERGKFWPRPDMQNICQSDAITTFNKLLDTFSLRSQS